MKFDSKRFNFKRIILTGAGVIVACAVIYGIYISYQFIHLGVALVDVINTPLTYPVPCSGNPASSITIARPADTPIDFTTLGGDIFVMIKNIPSDGSLSDVIAPDASIRIGLAEVADKTIVHLTAVENEYYKFNLNPGRYWLEVGTGTKLQLLSCTPNGVSDPLPRP